MELLPEPRKDVVRKAQRGHGRMSGASAFLVASLAGSRGGLSLPVRPSKNAKTESQIIKLKLVKPQMDGWDIPMKGG